MNDALVKEIFGPNAARFISKLLVYAPREKQGFHCHVVAGVGVSTDQQTLAETVKTFEMWECEVLVIPRRKHLHPKRPLSHCTIEQALLCGYEDTDNYKEHIELH